MNLDFVINVQDPFTDLNSSRTLLVRKKDGLQYLVNFSYLTTPLDCLF